jgi:hypothetical protein
MSPQRKDRAWDVDKYGEFNVGEYSSGLVRKETGASQKRRHHGNDSSWLEHIHPTDDHWLEERERERSTNDGEPEPGASRLYPVPFGEIKLGTDRRDLVKGLIPRDSLSVVWPPSCGKSFVTFDVVMHVALGWDYRGRRVHQGPVVYCAFEGQNGIKARIEAWRQKRLAEAVQDVPSTLSRSPSTWSGSIGISSSSSNGSWGRWRLSPSSSTPSTAGCTAQKILRT